MKFLFTSLISGFCIVFFCGSSVNAQQFKWVKGGGSTYSFTTSSDWEQVRHMCTDPNGNIYVLSNVGPTSISADTFHTSAGNDNILVTSYTCNGVMRWAKLIYATTEPCYPAGIAADSLGNIYVAGSMPPSAGVLHVGYDTTISSTAYEYEQLGLVQFDTSGAFHWIRFVGQNTTGTGYGTLYHYFGAVLKVDAANNAHFFDYMRSGVNITTSVTSVYGTYDLMYNSSGTLLSQMRLDIDSQWAINDAVIDPVTNKLYVSGMINQSIYGGTLVDTFYAAAFDASRNRLWIYFCGHGDDDALTGVVMDKKRHLIFSGEAQPNFPGPTRFLFNGDSVSAPYDVLGIVMETDTNGSVDWVRHFDCHTSVNGLAGITLLPNDKIAAVGTFAGVIISDADSTPTSSGWDPYAVIVDSAGDLQVIQNIRGDGFYDEGTAITSDKVGNIYVGGEVADSIIEGGGIPAYHSVGGNTDFFVVKYGVDCSCISGPVSAYTDTGTHTVGLIYTGTTSGIDSVVWNFGDGSATVTGMTALHTYTTVGTFRPCATVYTSCGNDIYCTNVVINIPSLSAHLQESPEIKVYPNPVNDELSITAVQENTSYRLLTVAGVCVSQGALQQGGNTISMQMFVPGTYILIMTQQTGERTITKILKQ